MKIGSWRKETERTDFAHYSNDFNVNSAVFVNKLKENQWELFLVKGGYGRQSMKFSNKETALKNAIQYMKNNPNG